MIHFVFSPVFSELRLGLIQYLIYILFYQRFVEDRIINFIDLCSVSNISVFVLLERQYGYYIHGRSPYEKTDVNVKEMIANLEGEANRKIGTRGLQPNSDDQTFIVRVDKIFRAQYDLLLQNYRVRGEVFRSIELLFSSSSLESNSHSINKERRRT